MGFQPVEGHESGKRKAEESATDHSPVTTHYSPLYNWSRFLTQHKLGTGIAAGLLFVVMLIGWAAFTYLPNVAKNEQPQEEPPVEWIALLNHAHEAKWLDGTEPPAIRPRLIPGQRLAISSGLLEINYRTGAKVILEGPAEFVVGGQELGVRSQESVSHQNNSGYLALGKLVARCETAESKGFTIETGKGNIEDLGTEFAVQVDHNGKVALDVSSGEVVLRSLDGSIARHVAAGQYAYLDGAGVTVSTGTIRERFVYRVPERKWFSGDTSNVVPEGEIIIDDLVDDDATWVLTGSARFNHTGFNLIQPAVQIGRQAIAMVSNTDDRGSKTFSGITLASGKYTVMFLLGNYPNAVFPPKLTAEFRTTENSLADLLVVSEKPAPPLGKWVQWTLTYEVPPGDARIGETLQFSVQDGGGGNALFDGLRVRYAESSKDASEPVKQTPATEIETSSEVKENPG